MEGPGFGGMQCRECERLLDAYTRLAREYLDLMRRRKRALLERGWASLTEIDSGLEAENERRAHAKQALLEHDSTHRASGG